MKSATHLSSGKSSAAQTPFGRGRSAFHLAFLILPWLVFGSDTAGLAQSTNLPLDALRAALAPKTASWGRPDAGQVSRGEPDARAEEVMKRFKEVAGPWLAQRAAQAGAPAASLNAPDAKAQAVQALRERAGDDVTVHWREAGGTIAQVRGRMLERAVDMLPGPGMGSRNELTANRFLRANGKLLSLEAPDAELRLEREERDELGQAHLKYSQVFRGVPVWPAGLAVHLDRGGNVTSCDGAYVPTPALDSVEPTLDSASAKELAIAGVPGRGRATAKDPALVVYAPLGAAPRLAWKAEVSVSMVQKWWVVVDAEDGRVLGRISLCFEDGSVPGSGRDLAGTTRALTVWLKAGKYYLADSSKSMFDPAYDPVSNPHGVLSILDARNVSIDYLDTAYLIESTSATSWMAEGVSAAYNFSQTYDYFRERHNRNSIDGSGMNVQAVVRVGFDNACWVGELGMMFFGNARAYPQALDVVGHELTHGVTEKTAGLVYQFQPGAMNEAFSDIFGEMVESRTRGQNDWKLGTDLGFIVRDIKNPRSLIIPGLGVPYPSKMSEYVDLPLDSDHGGVHINGTIISYAFYLAAQGLSGAIGLRDTEKVFYRCLTQHLQKQSQFVDARLGCIASAEEIFGSGTPQVQKITEAFDAVEVVAAPPPPPPPPLPPVSGEDSTLLIGKLSASDQYFALGRREAAFSDPNDGIALVLNVKDARPSVTGDGAMALYVDAFNDAGSVMTSDWTTAEKFNLAGYIHSIAISPDSRFFAFVLRDPALGKPLNKIYIGDLVAQTNHTYELVAPVTDGGAVKNVLYADSMVFTPDSKALLYDAISDIRFGSGSVVERWSIFRIDLASGATTILVPPLEEADFGNPNIGRLSNRYLTFDAIDAHTGVAQIFNMDLYSGDVATVGFVGLGLGFPTFSGDERSVIFAQTDVSAATTGASLISQALGPNRLTAVGLQQVWLPDAVVGVIYRRGGFTSSNAVPTVTLTAPANQSVFTSPAIITMTATASDPDGSVAKVEFYEGANKLGESPSKPYTLTWYNVAEGNYRLVARAIDDLGAAKDSAPVMVKVNPNPFLLGFTRTGNELTATIVGARGKTCEIQTTSQLGNPNWTPVATVVVTNTTQPVSLGAPSASASFWRARVQ